jgi:hypothetical protein
MDSCSVGLFRALSGVFCGSFRVRGAGGREVEIEEGAEKVVYYAGLRCCCLFAQVQELRRRSCFVAVVWLKCLGWLRELSPGNASLQAIAGTHVGAISHMERAG